LKFIIFVIDDESRSGGPEEMRAINTFNEKLRNQCHWVLAAGLESPTNSFVIDNRKMEALMSKGSLFDLNDFYRGLWTIEVGDLDTAKALAQEGSAACNRRVKLRPFL
jgi:hypothetical protein